jgi:uncharacterized repeat protein (TIGR02543 family)
MLSKLRNSLSVVPIAKALVLLLFVCSFQSISISSAPNATAADGDPGSLDFGSANSSKFLETTTVSSSFAFGTGDLTVEFWWKPTNTNRSDVMDFWSDPGAGSAQTTRFLIGTFGGSTPQVYIDDKLTGGSGVKISAASNLTLNAWSHIAVTRSTGVLKMWVNGTQAGSSYSNSLDMGNVGMKLSIMKDHGASTYGSGNLADIRVLKGAAKYTSNFIPPSSPLTSIANTQLLLNTKQGVTFLDDSSNNAIKLVTNNNPSTSTDSPYKLGSISFNGSNQWLTVAGNANTVMGTGDFTWECWVKTNGVGADYQAFFDSRLNPLAGGDTTGFYFGFNFQNLKPMYYTGSMQAESSIELTAGNWTHVALTRSSGTVRIFVNGAVAATRLNDVTNLTNERVFIGSGGNGLKFNGNLSNLAITKGRAKYTSAFTPSSSSLSVEADTQLLLGTPQNGSYLNDSSPNLFVATRSGTPLSSSDSPFPFYLPPTISTISPASGGTLGNSLVTISGTSLSRVTEITFGGVAGTELIINSSTSIQVRTPSGSVGSKSVVATSPSGSNTVANGFTYVLLPSPNISSLSVTRGLLAGGNTTVITGSNLDTATSVTVGGAPATIISNTSTSLSVTTPAGTLGAKDVVVTTSGGSATQTSAFTYVGVPTITTLSVTSGLGSGGTSTTISGTHLDSTTIVYIGAETATIISNSSTAIVVTTRGGSDGVKDVIISNAGGSAASVGAFTYFSKFSVTYVGGPATSGTAPTQVALAPGETFTVASGSSLSKTGYTFLHWKDSGDSEFAAGSTFTISSSAVSLTAQWLIDTFTVTFNANSGTGGNSVPADYGSNAISSAPTVTRTKYAFGGWAETTTASSISTWTVTGPKTLYALWEPITYTITYSPESGTVTTSFETFTVLSKPANWQTPTRNSYVFDGWYTDTSYSTLRGLGGAVFTSNDTETVYAKWTQESIAGIPAGDRTFVDSLGSSDITTKTLTIESGSTGASIRVPSGAFAIPTTISVYSLGNSNYAKSKIDATKEYVVNLIVAWVASDGTVPVASPALTMTITNPAIKSGAIVYGLLGNTYTQLGTATADGSVAFSITTDPVITIANPVVTPPAPPAPGGGGGGGSSGGGSVSVTTTTVVDDSAAIKAAKDKAEAEAKAKAELDLKAAQDKAAAELQAARDKADAEIKAAQLASDAAALLKAEEEAKLAAERKAAEDAKLASSIAVTNIVPDVSLFSVSASLKLSTYDTAYLKKYVKSLKPKATVTCIGYIYTAKTKVSVATTRAKKQATAVCSIIKKMKPTLITKVVLVSSKKAPKAAVGAKWVAVSYRVDGYKS